MCQCFSKIEDLCSQARKQAAKEVFENKMHYHGTMKTVARAYLNNREGSVYFLSELKLRRIFPAVYFVNTNQVYFKYSSSILPEKELSELPDGSPNIFKRLIIMWKNQVIFKFFNIKIVIFSQMIRW